MLNKIRLFANGASRPNRAPISRRRTQRSLRVIIVGIGLLGYSLLTPAVRADGTYTIYLYNSQGVLQDETAYYFVQNGHVYSIATGAQIGSIPNMQTGTIFDTNGNDIGDVVQAS